jgi:hypothetical protein
VIEYPKIETLFDRDEKTRRVIEDRYRCPEFAIPLPWEITEKIDGTNVRVAFEPPLVSTRLVTSEPPWSDWILRFGGRTANAQLHVDLFAYLSATFALARMGEVFSDAVERRVPVTLFGEGYRPKIQRGGGYRCDGPSFRIFDVIVGGVWLERHSREDIARSLGIQHAPFYGTMTTYQAVHLVRTGFRSSVSQEERGDPEFQAEGVVARSSPLLFDRMGRRVMWKLKARDFTGGKR